MINSMSEISKRFYTGHCKRLNMNCANCPWKNAATMRHWHGYDWDMVSLGSRAYAMGGYRNYRSITDIALNKMERYDENSNSWTDVAAYPRTIFRHGMAADEEPGRIWVVGGTYRSGTSNYDWREVRYYQVAVKVLMIVKNVFRNPPTPGMAPGI